MLANIGVFVALAVLITLALRGVNIFIATILSALIVALTNGQSIATAFGDTYVTAMFAFAQKYFLIFLAGAIFGRVMSETKAAESIALR